MNNCPSSLIDVLHSPLYVQHERPCYNRTRIRYTNLSRRRETLQFHGTTGEVILEMVLRPRLNGTRQIFIRTNIRADTPCVYKALLYQDKFWITNPYKFNLLRKCTSAGQIFVRYRVNANRDEYLYGSVSDSCLNFKPV